MTATIRISITLHYYWLHYFRLLFQVTSGISVNIAQITKQIELVLNITAVETTNQFNTAWKLSKYGVFSSPNAREYGPKKSPYLDTFHIVKLITIITIKCKFKARYSVHLKKLNYDNRKREIIYLGTNIFLT